MTNNLLGEIKKGKKERKDCYLPIMYFPAADPFAPTNWIDTLGEKAFCAWLKLYTLADRKNLYDGKYSKTPQPMEDLAKLFKISKSTLYRTIIKPLWNYGFIDFVEVNTGKVGQKAVNIIVYDYPQNDADLEKKELVKIRDYDTDYKSAARTNALLGGRPSNSEKVIKEPMGFKNETVHKYKLSRTNVVKSNRFKNETAPVSKMKPTNIQKGLNKQKGQVIKRLSPKSKISDVDLENASLLYEKMLENFPKTLKPNMEKWADEFRLLREKLKEPDATVKFIIDWSQNHTFWKGNIRSASTFREKYDKLYIQAKTDIEKQQQPNTTSMYDDLIEKQLREAAEKKERLERGNIRGNEINPDNKPFLS